MSWIERTFSGRFLAALFLLTTFAWQPAEQSFFSTAWEAKVDPVVLGAAADAPTEFIVFLEAQANLNGASQMKTKLEKGAYVYQQLTQTAQRTQGPLLKTLQALDVEHRPYWIANMIWVRGGREALQALAERREVAHVYANPQVQLDAPEVAPLPVPESAWPAAPDTVDWNITRVRANEVWAAGFTGQGVVVGGQDTGYDWDHPALKEKYRGWRTATGVTDHNYNWHDAIHQDDSHTLPGNPCGFNSPVPCDDSYHGTHTMGTMVGDDGIGNQIGMAPDAEWIGCRNMEQGWGTPITYSECFEWFTAPYPYGGDPFEDGNPSQAPDVINNSWACPHSEGCTDPMVLLTVVNNVRAAGIVTVQSAGNSGPNCFSVNTPAAIYEASFTVGNTTSTDTIATSSSRGPASVGSTNYLKPNVTAPGTGIRSSIPGTGYSTLSGTSMAAPHVAGLVALVLSAQPGLAGQVEEIETLIERNAAPLTAEQTCDGIPGSQVPNNTYGWGRIDAWTTLQNIPHKFRIHKSIEPGLIKPGMTVTYTLEITHLHPFSTTHNVVLTDTLPLDTTFITATLPHSLEADQVHWSFGDLAKNASRSVQLVLQVSPGIPQALVNQSYGARSNEAPTLLGPPLRSAIARYFYYFPYCCYLR